MISQSYVGEDEDSFDIHDIDLRREVKKYYKVFPRNNSFNISERIIEKLLEPLDLEPPNSMELGNEQKKKKENRANSMVELNDLKKIYNELWE